MGCLFWFCVIYALFTGGFGAALGVFICLILIKAMIF